MKYMQEHKPFVSKLLQSFYLSMMNVCSDMVVAMNGMIVFHIYYI